MRITIEQWKWLAGNELLSPLGLRKVIHLMELDGKETLKQERDRWLSENPPTPTLSQVKKK